jgi:hypothetical protein
VESKVISTVDRSGLECRSYRLVQAAIAARHRNQKDLVSLSHCKFLLVATSEISGSGVGVADCSVRARSLRLDYLIRCGVGSCKQNILWLPLS